MDVTNSKSILKAANEFKNPIDLLVCNAGVNNGKGDIFSKEHNEKTILEVMMVNVAGPFLTVQNLYDNLNKKTVSKVVIISSLMGTLTPIILDKLGFNPALASGPFITTSIDILGLAIYFMVAIFLNNY